jgi:outer membrane receptor protein involved in Fe transport
MVELKVEPRLGPMFESTTRLHGNYYGYRGDFAHFPEGGGLEHLTFDGQWVGAEQRFVYKPLDAVRVTVGGEVQEHFDVHELDTGDTTGVLDDDRHNFSLVAAYVVGDVAPARWIKMEAGGRLDAYSTFGSSASPRGAVILRPTDRDNVKLLGGKAFRAPSIYELYYSSAPQYSNPNLTAENMVSGEIEVSHRFTPTLTGLVSAYDNVITGLIAQRAFGGPAADGTQPFQYQNTDAPVVTLGAEAEVRREWKDGWMVAVSYSYQRSKYVASTSLGDLLSQKQNPAFREVPNAPEHLASLKGAVPVLARALEASTRLTLTSARWDRNDQPFDPKTLQPAPTQGQTEPALLWDLVLSGTEQRWGLSYALGVYNAFDWRWSVPVSPEFRQTTIPQSGRTFLATAGLTL